MSREILLWRGLSIAKKEGIKTIIVLGDSMLVIKAMIDLANPGGSKLNSIIYQIK
jgi:hypothetical protein